MFFLCFLLPFSLGNPSEEELENRLKSLEEGVSKMLKNIEKKTENVRKSDFSPPTSSIWTGELPSCPSFTSRKINLYKVDDYQGLKEVGGWRMAMEKQVCNVLYLSSDVYPESKEEEGMGEQKTPMNSSELAPLLGRFEAVISPSEGLVPYGEREWPYIHRASSYVPQIHHFDAIHYKENATSLLPDHVFVLEDGPLESQLPLFHLAFSLYYFSVIYAPLSIFSDYPPKPYFQALERHTVPMVLSRDGNYFLPLGFRAEDAMWRVVKFEPEEANSFLKRLLNADKELRMDELLYYRWLNLRIQQDIATYKYHLPLESRLHTYACEICADHRRGQDKPFILAGILSTRRNFLNRMTIRQTWGGNVYQTGVGNKEFIFKFFFFVCRAPDGEEESDEEFQGVPKRKLEFAVQQELYGFMDTIELDCVENYRNLTRKSLEMIRWVSEAYKDLDFFLRVDDDVYLRPQPILEQLRKRSPVRYWWGSFAFLSSVSRDPSDVKGYNALHNDEMAFGDSEMFPMYSRGVLYALSGDLLNMVAERSYLPGLKSAHPDDSALGVYIFQLVAERRTFVNVDDRDENRLSLNPYCVHRFSQLHSKTWAVHHLNASQLRCMWETDIVSGYYQPLLNRDTPSDVVLSYWEEGLTQMASNYSLLFKQQLAYLFNQWENMQEGQIAISPLPSVSISRRKRNGFADLCPCATAVEDEGDKEENDWDSSYDRIMP